MLNTAVVYATRTKHSKKIAEAVGASLGVEARNIADKPPVSGMDLLFIAGGIYGGVSLPDLLAYLRQLEAPLPKSAAILTSCASGTQKQTAVRDILEEKGVRVLGEFICKGKFLFVSASHPNEKDLNEAKAFARKMVETLDAGQRQVDE